MWISVKEKGWPEQWERVIAYTPTDIPSIEYRIVPPGEFAKVKDATHWKLLEPPK